MDTARRRHAVLVNAAQAETRGVSHVHLRRLQPRRLLDGSEARGAGLAASTSTWAAPVPVSLGTYGEGVPRQRRGGRQRQIGIEIGLSLEEILNSVGGRARHVVGATLHILGDNIRFRSRRSAFATI